MSTQSPEKDKKSLQLEAQKEIDRKSREAQFKAETEAKNIKRERDYLKKEYGIDMDQIENNQKNLSADRTQ